ncbi:MULTISPECIES: 2-aminoethylphosphonate--pyruvate transaminase [unclassified Paenibacillus]|uniref:2-aminoethylphosphonate--pyruvate transaminase n=1 Tax=unclassified Paenibacillus TaxID=185978 RepID=UPI000955FCB2|nr:MULTISPECIES: 2-aminoethylphosphonate--pyruvate transaminase [unclassified Paenibacillus]ASS67362.1 2-aminoethylphosphonate--pyruvate transaminase [Paenibacillus sp. RUD330]SIQ79984.1 2-aminoethylphosphonate-pyruvate transaminase [Paenibacillus sp. RU4X]SIR01388.1 2-aminoethylphosphonate-pyruvate transaminase [Paenibacillus sp. RU4T]
MRAERPYLLLTPGPLSTTATVKEAMLRDWCTWDDEYNGLVQSIRERLTLLAAPSAPEAYTAVLMQGSGTFSVEAAVGTALPRDGGRLLVAANGAYGERLAQIAELLGIGTTRLGFGEVSPVSPERLDEALAADSGLTHVAIVHCETTTGILNPLSELAAVVRRHGREFIVDAMSSFGGIPLDAAELGIDWLISSSNKCIQGVPGFGFVIARRAVLERCGGHARSLSLDLHGQWETMEKGGGKWRFTSPTHVVRAFDQALRELDEEGGIAARHRRYVRTQRTLTAGMEAAGFAALLPQELQSPIITAFLCPDGFEFRDFYGYLKQRGYVIYPGKISAADTFRIGSIGDVQAEDLEELAEAAAAYMAARRTEPAAGV